MEQPEGQKRKLEEETQAEVKNDEPSNKKARVGEGEHSHAKIKKQIEYYFSDSNYRRDKWLQEEAAKHPEGFIEIAKIAAFPRLQSMTTDVNVIIDLMRSSERLTVSEDGLLVKRAQPLPAEDNSIQRSVYVKGLPEDITLDDLDVYFGKFGEVARVSIFRHKDSKKPKGEAVVEFETEETAKTAAAVEKQDYNGKEITVTPKVDLRKRERPKRKADAREAKSGENAEDEEEEVDREEEKRQRRAEELKRKEERLKQMRGTVVHVTFVPNVEGEPLAADFNKWDVKTAFEEATSAESVKFVELRATSACVRMDSVEEAQRAVTALTAGPKVVKGVKFDNVRPLAGDEENEYLEKVYADSSHKYGRSRGRGGGRGGGRGRGGRGRGGKRGRN